MIPIKNIFLEKIDDDYYFSFELNAVFDDDTIDRLRRYNDAKVTKDISYGEYYVGSPFPHNKYDIRQIGLENISHLVVSIDKIKIKCKILNTTKGNQLLQAIKDKAPMEALTMATCDFWPNETEPEFNIQSIDISRVE